MKTNIILLSRNKLLAAWRIRRLIPNKAHNNFLVIEITANERLINDHKHLINPLEVRWGMTYPIAILRCFFYGKRRTSLDYFFSTLVNVKYGHFRTLSGTFGRHFLYFFAY